MERIILHSDLNNFYASVECLYRPELRGSPVAVSGNPEERRGIVLAKNSLAKAHGVETGDPLWIARRKCPEILFVPPHYDRYLRFSAAAREICSEYTDQVESFGLDECWLDVTGSTSLFGSGKRIADELRRRIRWELGVTVSVGVSFNKIFAKLGSDLKKPDATTVISAETFREMVWPLPVRMLLYVGRATQNRLIRYGVRTIGDLANSRCQMLYALLGENGRMLWRFANGLDTSPVSNIGTKPPVRSIGNSTTLPRDLTAEEEIRIPLRILCESVSARMREMKVICRTVQLGLRDCELSSVERRDSMEYPNRTGEALFRKALELFRRHHNGKPVRSVSIRACDLAVSEHEQLSLLPEPTRIRRQECLESAVDSIRERFGPFVIRRGIMLTDPRLSELDPKNEHLIYPAGYYHKRGRDSG